MFKPLLPLAIMLTVAGCSSDVTVDQNPLSASTVSAIPTLSTSPAVINAITDRPMVKTPLASLPDRGALLAYARDQQPRQREAFTYHPVQLSEAHALNAAAPGRQIELPMPNGQTMRADYRRHEESLDGNWTWIGRTTDGLDAVITFGQDAVFGRIDRLGQEALRLTMADGGAWLVETDASKLLDGNLLRDSDESDTLIPPKLALAALARKRATAAATASNDIGIAASPANTVDVVLGYTNGLVTKYGSANAANTRLINLIAITNTGYEISLITPRVRLVRTQLVNYTDTNDNETALEALTGVICNPGCTTQPVPPELQPLRTTRDQFGGDLVSLVRPFQAPQHQGCGIAWLLGGGGFTIDNTDAPFGYSIVSDGTDVDEGDGRTYFCREETLAHELGHNMGQAHNTEDSSNQGTHSYSYGYREATTTGFYTVMAYRMPSSSQFSINYFANPNVTYSNTGRPTGTATADNARSLNLSMPLVVQFRAAVVPFGSAPRLMAIAKSGQTGTTEVYALDPSPYTFFSLATSTILQWTNTGFQWEFAVGDYNSDGIKDLYAINKMGVTGTTQVHVLNGATNYQSFLTHLPTILQQTGTNNNWLFRLGDYDRNGSLDLYAINRNGITNKTQIHVLNGSNNFGSFLAHISTVLEPTGTDGSWNFELGDWNSDSQLDLYAIHKTNTPSNMTQVHILNGANNFSSFLFHQITPLHTTGTDYTWDFKVGDYNLDGVGDIYAINRQGITGKTQMHVLDGQSGFTTFSAHIATALPVLPTNNSWAFELF